MANPVLDPNQIEDLSQGGSTSARWMTVIFNNDTNDMDEVVEVLMRATGCDAEEAAIETWEAHTYGKAPVHFASRGECENVARVISQIGVQTEVTLEWPE
jgi:ATP-dependent Clp protease adaptor protein ClpS